MGGGTGGGPGGGARGGGRGGDHAGGGLDGGASGMGARGATGGGASGGPVGVVPLNNLNRVNGGVALCRCSNSVFLISYNVSFPSRRVPNVSVMVPSFACILRGGSGVGKLIMARKRRSRVNTVPCLLGGFGIPVCTAGLAVNLVRKGLGRRHLLRDTGLGVMGTNAAVALNGFSVRFVRMGRSVPSTITFTVGYTNNAIIRANSFGVSAAPVSSGIVSVTHFSRLNGRNILTLLTSSAGTRHPKFATSRELINNSFSGLFERTRNGQVVMTAFSSGVREVRRVVSRTTHYGHGITISNEDVLGIISMTDRLNCLGIPGGILVRVRTVGGCAPNRVIIIAAKDRNRPLSTLRHVTFSSRHRIRVTPSSVVVVSTAPVPNGRGLIAGIVGRLVGHNTGIICREVCSIRISKRTYTRRLGLVVDVMGPRCFVPLRNRRGRLVGRTRLTELIKVPGRGAIVTAGNSIVRLAGGRIGYARAIRTNHIVISNLNINSINDVILHSEGLLSSNNVVVITMSVSTMAHRVITKPSVISHNFVCVGRSRRLVTRVDSLM